MASLVGHVLGATAVWGLGRRLPGPAVPRGVGWYLLPAAVALAPDLDSVAPMVFRSLGPMAHRGPSHSLLGAVVLASCAGAVVSLLGSRERRPCRALAVLLGCALVHPALDYLMAGGPPVPFLWPFVRRGWLSPVQLIPTAYYARTASGLLGILLHPRTWAGIALELTSLGPLWLAASRRRIAVALACLVASAGGFLLTWAVCR